MLEQRNYNEMVTYILDQIRGMDISEDAKKTLFAYITSLESKYFMEMGNVPRWIPCSERLPETEEMMLVTCKAKNGNYTVNRAYYWDKTESWHGTGTMAKVIAWMPLPVCPECTRKFIEWTEEK